MMLRHSFLVPNKNFL
uniref:Uncharacterized protein n=1 Tax=Rhizophora mucronata TaxID=61149 RepID=A0A2P2P0L0_RHIMU